MAALQENENVPGLYEPDSKVVEELRIGPWKFQRLDDGSVFASMWSGAPDTERMTSHILFDSDEASELSKLFSGD